MYSDFTDIEKKLSKALCSAPVSQQQRQLFHKTSDSFPSGANGPNGKSKSF